jgi:hypothetical protein
MNTTQDRGKPKKVNERWLNIGSQIDELPYEVAQDRACRWKPASRWKLPEHEDALEIPVFVPIGIYT